MPPSTTPPRLLAWAFPHQQERLAQLRARRLLREHVLDALDAALSHAGLSAALVKGAATSSLYPLPYTREMGDLDLLADAHSLPTLRRTLVELGWSLEGPSDRPRTEHSLELALRAPAPASMLVELHAGLDKVVPRLAMTRAILERSALAPQRRALRLPTLDDQALLVILHLANDELGHRAGYVDLEVLLAAGASLERVLAESARWGAATACFAVLSVYERLLPGSVPAELLRRAAPHGLRERALERLFVLDPNAPERGARSTGYAWILRQSVLRDDTTRWLRGLLRYAGERARERVEGLAHRRR